MNHRRRIILILLALPIHAVFLTRLLLNLHIRLHAHPLPHIPPTTTTTRQRHRTSPATHAPASILHSTTNTAGNGPRLDRRDSRIERVDNLAEADVDLVQRVAARRVGEELVVDGVADFGVDLARLVGGGGW